VTTGVLARANPAPTRLWGQGISNESNAVVACLWGAQRHMARPISRQSVRSLFEELAATWHSDTAFESSMTALVNHPAYQRIIGLGPDAVPYLLLSLKTQPDHWFAALTAITGADPVSRSDRGDIEKMAAAWLDWGRARRIIS
jgi:hypothetical protein